MPIFCLYESGKFVYFIFCRDTLLIFVNGFGQLKIIFYWNVNFLIQVNYLKYRYCIVYFSCWKQFFFLSTQFDEKFYVLDQKCSYIMTSTQAQRPSFHLIDWHCSRKYLSCFHVGRCMCVTCCVSSVNVPAVKRGWLNGQGLEASSLGEFHEGDTCKQGWADGHVVGRHTLLYMHSTRQKNCGWETVNINEAFKLGCTK